MATTTTNVEQVKLNIMTQAQYDAATKSATELYMITDAEIDTLPDQTGQSGKFLTTNGTTASWSNIPNEIPAQSGQSGKFLSTNGTAVSWTSLATVAVSGSYNDLINKPVISDTFDKTSHNAMSGTAVAEGIQSIKRIDCGTMSTMQKQITLE